MSEQWDPLPWAMTTISAPWIRSGQRVFFPPHSSSSLSTLQLYPLCSHLQLIEGLANSRTHNQLPQDSLHWRGPWHIVGVIIHTVCVCVQRLFSPVRLCNCSRPGSSVHGILLARILEWVAMPLLQGTFLTQGLSPHLLCPLPWQVGSLPPVPPGKAHYSHSIGDQSSQS